MSNIIDLAPYWGSVQQAQVALATATAALRTREEQFLQTKSAAQVAVVSQLDRGATTGNPFKDDALRFFGFDADRIEKLLAFDEKLVAAKGQEFLIVSQTKNRIRCGGEGDECANDYRYTYRATLGILSGDHSKLGESPSDPNPLFPALTLPFAKYVHCDEAPSWGSGHVGCLHLSPYLVESPGNSFLSWEFFEWILKIPIGHDRGDRLSIFLGDEIASKDIGSVGAVIEQMRKVLHAPTEAEQVKAAGI